VENRRWGDVEREELEVWKFDGCEPSVILCAVGEDGTKRTESEVDASFSPKKPHHKTNAEQPRGLLAIS
jgi:hypothetical protein